MRISEHDQKVIGFLESYPDYSPSPEQVSHMTESLKRKLVQDGPSTLSWIDGIFAVLFVPVLLVLLSADGIGAGKYFGMPWLAQGSSLIFMQVLLVFLVVAIPPLLLVILPLNDRR